MLIVTFMPTTWAGQEVSSEGLTPSQGDAASHFLAEALDEIAQRWDELDQWMNEIVEFSGSE